MKPVAFLLSIMAPVLLAGTLAGCGAFPGRGGSEGRGAGAGRIGMGGMMGDQNAMCELNRRMQDAGTPEERQALADQYLAGMSEETREQRLRMMRDRCR
jgi:hypothetical protein